MNNQQKSKKTKYAPIQNNNRYRAIRSRLILLALLIGISFLLNAQTNNAGQLFPRRIVWRGGENALRYAVEIQKSDNGTFRPHIREFTTALFIQVSLPAGEYRFRIIPYDILDRPTEGTQWMHFTVRPPAVPSAADTPQVIDTADYSTQAEQKPEPGKEGVLESPENPDQADAAIPQNSGSPRFNTLGVSVGSSFIDPLLIAAIHGSYAPVRNIFIELGCDFGFISKYKDVKSFYCIFPFIHAGYFLPFREKGGIFAGAGGGYMLGSYAFPEGKAAISEWGFNITAGLNLFDFLNISYTLRTNFTDVSHKAAIGYVYRFRSVRQ